MRGLVIAATAISVFLLMPGAAQADDSIPAPFAAWAPPGEWQPIGSGAETHGDNCPGGWKSWRRADDVVLVLKAFTCPESALNSMRRAASAVKASRSEAWQRIPSALPQGADFVGDSGETAHYRMWIEAGHPVILIVNCPGRPNPDEECINVSGPAALGISATVPGDPEPIAVGDPVGVAGCCAKPRTAEEAAAVEVLRNWQPSRALDGDWVESPVTMAWSDQMTPLVCERSSRGWTDAAGTRIFLQWWTCGDAERAAEIARRAAVAPEGPGRWASAAPALGPHRDVLMTLPPDHNGHVRTWAQGGIAVVLGMLCGPKTLDQCAETSAGATREISAALPGEIVSTDVIRLFIWNGLLAGLLIFGASSAISRGMMRFANWQPYDATSDHPRWHDVWDKSFDAIWSSRALARARWMSLLSVLGIVIGVLGLFQKINIGRWWSIGLLLVGLLLFRRARRRARQSHTAVGDAVWRMRYRLPVMRMRPRRLLGVTICVIALMLAAYVLAMWFGAAWIYAGGGFGSARGAEIIQVLRSWHIPAELAVANLALMSGAVATSPLLSGTLLLSGLSMSVFVFRLGRRLSARALEEMEAVDERPHVLLLRNFEDDRVTLPPSRLTHRSMISSILTLLTYPRHVRFQEILVRQLTEIGPVKAVARPDTLVPQLGAAQASYGDDWLAKVEALAGNARAVVILAAPETINDGLRQELELVGRRLGHQRVMLVIPPRPARRRRKLFDFRQPGDLLMRWTLFRASTSHLPLFAPLIEPWIPDGVQILVHHPSEGWHAWGSRVRNEWTYAIAIHEISEFIAKAWPTTDAKAA